MPWPPPMHMVSRPYLPSRRFSSRSRLARMRPPVAPMGWPRLMPEPFTLSRSRSSQPQPLSTASTWGAKASFSSTRSMSSQESPVRSKRRFTAGTGPMPMREGSQPAAAQPTSQPIGSRPSSASLSSATTRQAAAASFCWLALPAVTTPPFSMAFSLPRLSGVASARTPSSLSKMIGSPRRRGALVAHGRVFVAGLAADLVVARQVVGGLDHAGDDPEAADRLAHHPPARQPVVHGHRAGAGARAHVERIVFDVAHALDAAGHHHVGRAGLHHHGGVDHRLQTRAAAPVELVAGRLDRKVGRQRRPAGDAGRLA